MTTTAPLALELTNVRLDYPDGSGTLTAVDDVSLTLRRGEFVGVTGPSGSGKSSLLSIASTLQPPTRGSVRVAGTPVFDDDGRSLLSSRDLLGLRRDRIGVVFQQPQLIASLTAQEQLLIVDSVRGGDKKEALVKSAGLLDLMGLGAHLNRRPAELSGGQRQRVNIARALMGDPAVLLVDEPTSALDAERSLAVVNLLEEVTREFSTGTLMVTHEIETLEHADRIITMVDGRVTND
jgi:putative ABC transport system ATP-binding protein